jgi:hypothetical protein
MNDPSLEPVRAILRCEANKLLAHARLQVPRNRRRIPYNQYVEDFLGSRTTQLPADSLLLQNSITRTGS